MGAVIAGHCLQLRHVGCKYGTVPLIKTASVTLAKLFKSSCKRISFDNNLRR